MEGYFSLRHERNKYGWIANLLFVTRDSRGGSCSVTARSFPCHNKVSGPSQHFFKTETLNSCSELCAVSSGTLPPTTSRGSFIPQQHKPGFLNAPNTFDHLSQTYFHSLQCVLANTIVFYAAMEIFS